MRPNELQQHYYLDHFEELLGFVESQYRNVLSEANHQFLSDFRSLDHNSRCLYTRLANRKGLVFRLDQIRYSEIEDLSATIGRLSSKGFVRDLKVSDFKATLERLNREELIELTRSLNPVPVRVSGFRKSDLIAHLRETIDFETFRSSPLFPEAIVQGRSDDLAYFLFLYFGRNESSLTAFALRDLGLIRTQRSTGRYQPRFTSREVAEAAFLYRKLLDQIEMMESDDLLKLAEQAARWPAPDDLETMAMRHRTVHRLGRALERLQFPERALAVYQLSDRHPATERAVRLLVNLGRLEEAEELLRRLIDEPSTDHELLFAEDFLRRKFGTDKVGRLTQLLRSAEVLKLDESGRDYPERAAALHLSGQSTEVLHLENRVWVQLFSIAFADLLFSPDDPHRHSEFDRLPSGLNSEAFYEQNKVTIEQLLKQFDTPESLSHSITQIDTFSRTEPAEEGKEAGSILLFDQASKVAILALIQFSPRGALQKLLREMAQDFRRLRSGYPDLMLIEPDRIRFIEVKSPGDQLQRHQLVQLERLRRVGFEVAVNRVEWIVDPEQDYVVIDVETTGGNAKWNRVTEIGAVRVRGGQIVDEWSSLVNPQTRIPRRIVELTGITDEMVATAPLFAEIADALLAFIGDAVFVGHRVKFDYGFIREEFSRAGVRLRCPTLCTVVETRRYFPGLPSYSLANLTKYFGITLDNHHRALCDAQATAEILLKINEKRISDSDSDHSAAGSDRDDLTTSPS